MVSNAAALKKPQHLQETTYLSEALCFPSYSDRMQLYIYMYPSAPNTL